MSVFYIDAMSFPMIQSIYGGKGVHAVQRAHPPKSLSCTKYSTHGVSDNPYPPLRKVGSDKPPCGDGTENRYGRVHV